MVILIIRLFALIPFSLSQAIGRQIGRLLYRYRTRSREVTRVNLSLTHPELKDEQKEKLVQQSLLHAGMTSAEIGVMWGANPKKLHPLVKKVHNLDVFLEYLCRPSGLLIFAPHQSNWEILNTVLTSHTDITIMYKPLKNSYLNEWMIKRRNKVGANLTPTTRLGVETLFNLLNQNKVIGFLPDQEPKRERGEFAPFYKSTALTPKLPYELIQKTGCNVIFAAVIRLEKAQGFDVFFIEPDSDVYSSDEKTCLSAINKGVEACIDLDIKQYNWVYKRFKQQPDDDKNPYDEANVP